MAQAEYLRCPCCGWLKPISYGYGKNGPREVRLDKVDLETANIWELKELRGAGRGSPEAKIETIDGKKLRDLPEPYKSQLLSQCKKIIEILGSVALMGAMGFFVRM